MKKKDKASSQTEKATQEKSTDMKHDKAKEKATDESKHAKE
ncbi:hypothetical protein [Staphylococcus hyicus]